MMLLTSKSVLTGSLRHAELVGLLLLWLCTPALCLMQALFCLYSMLSDHQQLSKLVQEAPTIAVREDLERELEALVGKMEAKADQISKVRRHWLQVSYLPMIMLL